MRTKICLTLAVGFIGLLVLAAPAVAQDSDDTIATSVDATGILWVEVSLSTTDAAQVQVRIFSPKRAGPRELWQSCKFIFSGAGTYRCGIDVAAGTPAQRKVGTWTTSVTIDGTKVAQTKFSVTQ